MRGGGAPDAFICRNDPTAAKLMQTLGALNIKVRIFKGFRITVA